MHAFTASMEQGNQRDADCRPLEEWLRLMDGTPARQMKVQTIVTTTGQGRVWPHANCWTGKDGTLFMNGAPAGQCMHAPPKNQQAGLNSGLMQIAGTRGVAHQLGREMYHADCQAQHRTPGTMQLAEHGRWHTRRTSSACSASFWKEGGIAEASSSLLQPFG